MQQKLKLADWHEEISKTPNKTINNTSPIKNLSVEEGFKSCLGIHRFKMFFIIVTISSLLSSFEKFFYNLKDSVDQ